MPGPAGGADVAVIGGGLVGTCLAYELVCAGAAVVLVDRHDPGRATDAGAGILSPETDLETDPAWLDLAIGAGEHYRSFVSRVESDGEGPTGYRACGLLSVSLRERDDEYFERALQLIAPRANGVVEVSSESAQAMFPPLARPTRCMHNPRAARVDGRMLNAAVLRAAESRGLSHLRGAALGVRAGTGRSVRRVVAVGTTEGEVTCGAAAVCGGAWSEELADRLHVRLPVAPVKGQIVHLELPATDTASWPIVTPVLGYYLVPWPGGRVACGGTMEPEAAFDTRPTAGGLRQLLRECLLLAPGLEEATFVEVRVGLRPGLPDGAPALGALPGWDNLHVATGHGANGLLLGPYSALLVARGLLGDAPPQLAAFSATRFTGGSGCRI